MFAPCPVPGRRKKRQVKVSVLKTKKKKLNIEHREYTCFESFAIISSFILAVLTFPFSVFICFKVIYEYKRLVIFRLGKLRRGGARGPGLVFILPCVDEWFLVDLRLKTFEMYPQQLITKDSVAIRVELVIFYRLTDPLRATILVENYQYSTLMFAQTTFRTIVGRKTLNELLWEREDIISSMHAILIQGTFPWGIVIERVEIKKIHIPYELQKSFAAEAEANRRARAKFVAAQGEKAAATELLVAAQILSSRPAAIQMRYLQTLRTIAEDKNSTYIVPVPKTIVNSIILATSRSKIRRSITK